jgi:cytochrome c-type biogenesis protein CcmH
MTGFIVGASLLLLATVGLLAWPLLRRATPAGISTRQLTAAVYRDKLAELDQDLAAGSLSPADHALSRAELQRRLLDDSSSAADAPPTPGQEPPARSKALPLLLAALLPAAAIALYVVLGSPAAMEAPAHPQRFSQADIEKMVADLATKLAKEPDNHRGWAMLGRSYKMMGRFQEATQAYAKTGPMLDSSADLLVDYADAVAAVANGFNAQSLQLIDRALKLNPQHPQGLWMRGSAAFEARQYDRAIADWELLLAQMEPGSEDARTIAGNLAEARQKAGKPAAAGAAASGAASGAISGAASGAPPAAATTAPAGASLQGRVELSPELAKSLPPGAVLMVIARPADGTRMPVAVLKQPVSAFPAAFTLDDGQSLMAERRLSGFTQVLLEARVSRSGQAKAEPGDLIGDGVPAQLGARGVTLRIDRVVK